MRLPSIYPSLLNPGDGGTSPAPPGTPSSANHPGRCLKGNIGAALIKGTRVEAPFQLSEARLIKRMSMWENVAVAAVGMACVTAACCK